ncbi:uncharacterized protein PV06_04121 [Exophiala oligosperma]|uniref:DUF7702 domain-containing protein n=2 Tax=Chaetothyriales TaxID=34395 RepID=A0A0D2DTB4_9EURO|nr:uncharacterized protein PV06_04121 [Exophiala oligosperma]KIW45765.1 hypothetical protein PV06_04121 [Exophiala oligosperma]
MHFGSDYVVAAAELGVYIPCIMLACLVCARHGFSRSSGWYYTFTLCLIRIAGAVCQLLTLTDHSIGLLEAVLVLAHIGLSSLILSTLGMLSRIADWINGRCSSPPLSMRYFRLAQLVVVVGIILGIIGAIQSSDSSKRAADGSPAALSKVAVVCYVAGYAMLVFLTARALASRSLVPNKELLLVAAVCVTMPLVFIRLIYQVLLVFVHRGDFKRINAPVVPLVLMSVVEEFLTVFIYLFVGMRLGKLDGLEQGPISSRPWRIRGKTKRRGRRRGRDAEYQYPIVHGYQAPMPMEYEMGRIP